VAACARSSPKRHAGGATVRWWALPCSDHPVGPTTGGEVLGQAGATITTFGDEDARINDRIRAREVRLVGPDGGQIGIKPLPEALAIARSMDLDLVEVAANANPPVCRIMDFGKWKYEAAQRARESRRKTAHTSLKEMKYRPKISQGDFDTKTKKVEKFLESGNKVKVTIMFRGREVNHPELGMEILDRVAGSVDHVGKVDQAARLDGRNMTMVLSPDRKVRRRDTPADAPADETAPSPSPGVAMPPPPPMAPPPAGMPPAGMPPPAPVVGAPAVGSSPAPPTE
jgi:translation initiation factor IF-3